MLARITGKSIPAEARPNTTSFNINAHIRRSYFKWIGQILRDSFTRDDTSRLVYQLLEEQSVDPTEGDLLMDAPPHDSIYELRMLAINKSHWGLLASNIT